MISSGTQHSLSLPLIDFSTRDLKPGTSQWDSVRSQVRKALEEYGCFEALFDGTSMEQRKDMFEASKEIFDLPLETKMSTKTDVHFEGYLPNAKSLYEGMGFYGVDDPEIVDVLIRKIWPQGNMPFRKNVQAIGEKLIELNVMVRTMTLESFGLEKYIEEHLKSAVNHLHLIKYRGFPDNSEKTLGIDPHIDRNYCTILFQNDTIDGLEIKTNDGEEWIKAKPSQASSFIVIAGASFHLLLNGGVHPALHRVVITEKEDRYVTALFSPPKEGVIVTAPEEIVDDEHPRLFKPFDFWDFMEFSKSQNKGTDLSIIKAYCSL